MPYVLKDNIGYINLLRESSDGTWRQLMYDSDIPPFQELRWITPHGMGPIGGEYFSSLKELVDHLHHNKKAYRIKGGLSFLFFGKNASKYGMDDDKFIDEIVRASI